MIRLILICIMFVMFINNGLAQNRDTLLQVDSIDVKNKVDTLVNNADHKSELNIKRSGYLIKGQVIDSATLEGLPFSNIIFPHTLFGAVTDIDGKFEINLDKLPQDTLLAGALGFENVRYLLSASTHEYNIKINLKRTARTLSEFTISAKGVDPALLILRRIIEHKPKNNPDKAKNYSYESYNKLEADLERMDYDKFMKIPILKNYGFIFQNLDTTTDNHPSLPIYLTESLSDYYFRKTPKKQREIIKGSMVKGFNNDDVVKYLGTMYQNINVYKNSIPVFDKKFISPISDEAAFFYHYKIKDTQQLYNHRIIQVQFEPRRAGENCFTGDFWVVDTNFSIARISLEVPKTANINWVNHVGLYEEFEPVDSLWFLKRDKLIANFVFYNNKKIPGLIGRKTTTYHNIKINRPEIDSMLNNSEWNDEIIKMDSVMGKDDNWWKENRPDSLSKKEIAIHKFVDTINAMPITAYYKRMITFIASGVKDVGFIELGPYFYLYSANPIEGDRTRISIGTPRSINDFHLSTYVAYGFKDVRYKYGIEARYILNRKPWTYLNGTVNHDLSQGLDNFNHLHTDNIISGFIRKPGIMWKQVFEDQQRLEYFKQTYHWFNYSFTFQHRILTPYSPLPTLHFFHDVNGNLTNNVNSTDLSALFHYAYREKYVYGKYKRQIFTSQFPSVDIGFTLGVKGLLNSAYDYKKILLSVKQVINVPPIGHISYSVFAGRYFGVLPYLLLEVHPGNEYYYYDKYSFEMMNNYEFISDKYTGFTFEHEIGSGIFKYIPLLKKTKLRQFWTAKGVTGALNRKNSMINLNTNYPFRSLKEHPYLELGTGISNIFQIFRIDFDWRVMPKPVAEESPSKYFGLFFSAVFDF